MIGHDDVAVKEIVSLIAVMENRVFDDRGDGGVSKQGSALPRVGRDKVRCARFRAVLRSRHIGFRG